MIKKFLAFMGCASLLFGMVSCQDDGPVETPVEDVVYTAMMEQPAFVRSTVDLTNSAVVWTSGEEIGVIRNDGSTVENVALKVDPRGKATFTLAGDFEASYAVYPKIAKTYAGGNLTEVTLPGTYGDASAAYVEGCFAPMYADMSGTSKIIDFKQLGGILTIVLSKVPAGVDQMVFTAAGKQITGDFNVDLAASDPMITAAESASNNSVNWVFAATDAEQDMNFYIPLPVGTYEDMVVELKAGGEVVSTLKPAIQSIEMNRNTLAFFEVDYSVNLSPENKIANCYIVSEAGDYKFLATHKGNAYEDANKLGEIASVAVLWEYKGISENMVTAKKDLITNAEYKFGYIYFTATAEKGNALIAAYDGPNGTGNVLWSWHIWMTDEPAEVTLRNNQGIMMDRNLGATSALPADGTKTYGLLYQWGRKDPFVHTQANTSNSEGWAIEATSQDVGTVEYTIKNPMTFITCASSPKDWIYGDTRINTLWSNAGSIYDPCPAGWKLPAGSSGGVYNTALGTEGNPPAFDAENKGYNLGGTGEGKYLSTEDIWFPAAGYLHNGTGALSGPGTRICNWTCSVHGSAQANGFYATSDPKFYPSNGRDKALGQSVRCWKAPVAAAE